MNKSEHAAAIARIEHLMDAEAGTPEGDELKRLAVEVEAYDEIHFPVGAPNRIEAMLNELAEGQQRLFDEHGIAA